MGQKPSMSPRVALYNAAAKVCTDGCISCFNCGKSKSQYTLPPSPGNQLTECPLLKYNVVRKPIDPIDFLARWANNPTEEDINLLCEYCEHRDKSEDDGETFSLESCFRTHCISCPVQSVRDCIQESEAEARWS